jgi:PAS domain S-box-containing protein
MGRNQNSTANTMLAQIQIKDGDLRFSRQQFEALVNSINGIVWEIDPATSRTVFVSRQAESILGFPVDEILAFPGFWDCHRHPDDRSRVNDECDRAVAEGKPFRIEYRMATADGREVWLQDTVSVLFGPGMPPILRGVTLDISAQKKAADELARVQQQFVEASRQAGMAEIATGVLHNVGNVLNSVNVSATVVCANLRKSRLGNLEKVVASISEHSADLPAYLANDPRGRMVPGLLGQLTARLRFEQEDYLKELESLVKNIGHIKDIVAMQQNYARVSGVLERQSPAELVNDALQMNASGLARSNIEVVREFAEAPNVLVDKHKVLQILINLIRNAKYALEHSDRDEKQLALGVAVNSGGRVRITVRDNGIGIAPENLSRIFAHGFTTKKDGHGFGLHSCALAASEMNGSLAASSEGTGMGATFTLELPVEKQK